MEYKVISRGKVFFLLILIVAISVVPMASAATATLTPTAQAPGGFISVAGTGFSATSAVGIGFGAEVAVTTETLIVKSGSGLGPYRVQAAHYPMKPGTFRAQVTVTNGITLTSQVWDNGAGALESSSAYFASGTINYTSGELIAYYTVDQSGYTLTRIANYTHYEHNVTPATGVMTSASGSFSANITVPSVANGNYSVTAIDASGNLATSSLGVDVTIPEGLTIGVTMLLSSIAMLFGSRHFHKRSEI